MFVFAESRFILCGVPTAFDTLVPKKLQSAFGEAYRTGSRFAEVLPREVLQLNVQPVNC
jgi:hypothetical protein